MNKTLSIILLFIAGLFVGCERYDHLIQDLNDRIEVLEGATIAPITEQIKQINVSYTDLTTVDTALEALIKDLSEELLKLQQQADENSDAIAEITALIKELQDRDAALDQQIKDLKSYLDDEIKAAKYWAEATFATLEQYTEMQTEISRISALIEAYKAEQENDYTEAIDKAVTDVLAAITVSETSMKEWVNKILAEGYYDIAQIDAILFALETKLVGADAELTKEIEAQQAALELAKTDLTDAYKKAIKEAIEENNGKISKEIADAVQAALDNVDAKLAAINETITGIQSDIEAINTKIATIDEQILAINSSLSDLEAVDTQLEALIEALKTADGQHDDLIAQLEAKDLELDEAIADLKTYLESEISATEDWVEASFATLEQYADIQAEIATLATLISEQNDGFTVALEDSVAALETSIETLETSMKSWVSELLAEGYYDIAAIDGKLEAFEAMVAGADAELAKEIEAQQAALEQAKADLKASYEAAIAAAIEENNGKISKEIADAVQAALDNVDAKLAAINETITEIQSDIEAIKVKIASIEEQIENINASLDELQNVDASLQTLIDALSVQAADLQSQLDANAAADAAAKKELKEQIEALNALIEGLKETEEDVQAEIASLKTYVDSELKSTKDWAEATFATLDQYTALQTEIATITALLEQHKGDLTTDYTSAIATAVENMQAAITASEEAMKDWVEDYLADCYYDIAAIDGLLDALEMTLEEGDTQLAEQIAAQQAALDKAKQDLTDAYEKAIKEAIEENNGKITEDIAAAVEAAEVRLEAKITAINETITGIQSDIEAIKVKIASIDEQIENINASLDELQNVDASLQTLIDALSVQAADLQSQLDANAAADAAAKKELKEQIEALNALIEGLKETEEDVQAEIASLETYVDSELKSTKDWAEATFATLDQYTALQTEIATITALLEQHKGDLTTGYTSAIATAVENMQAAITASEKAMKDWVEDYLADCYYDIAAIDGLLAALEMTLEEGDTQLAEQIAAQQAALDKVKQDLTDAYEKAIKEAIEENNGKITEDITAAVEAAEVRLEAKITAINAEVESIKALINSLKETVNNLVDRIQSMRFIPEFSDGKVALGLGERTAELTFMISPRDAAAGVAAAWASTNDVVTAFIKPTQPRTKASYDMEALAVTNVTGNANGTLVVTISAEDLSEDFWYEGIEANVFVCISDGNNDIVSEMIPIYYVGTPYVTFKASAAQTLKIDTDVDRLQFSTDKGATWHSLTTSTDNATFGPDNDLLLRGINSGGTGNATISFMEGSVPVACSGDIRTLVDYRNYANVDTGSAKFTYLFSGCTVLTSAPELPATTLARACYSNMFNGCTGLTKAPSLPATQLASYCYNAMFCGCTGLMEAPELPATDLAASCYYSMFMNCTSLTSAPELPAETLAKSSYNGMFMGCTSLTSAPVLPAETLAEFCYQSMFEDCTSLTSAPELPAETLAVSCYEGMFSGCTKLEIAPALPAKTLAEYCYQSMFEDCTSLTSAPELPAETLAVSCYEGMFSGCTKLEIAPALPAKTLAESCYSLMFYFCEKLSNIKMLATNVSASRCLNEWVSGVAATGTFTKVAEVTLTTGISGIPDGWTVIQEASKGVDAPDFGFGGSFSN